VLIIQIFILPVFLTYKRCAAPIIVFCTFTPVVKLLSGQLKPGYNFQISALSSGEFIGLVADNPDEKNKVENVS
jgi:hypothetical protein